MATNNLGWTLTLIDPSAPPFMDYERDPDGRQTTAGTFNPQKWSDYVAGVRDVVGDDAWNSAVQAGYITPEGVKNERALPPLAPDYGNLPSGKLWMPAPQGATPDYVDPNYGPLVIADQTGTWDPTHLYMFLAAAGSLAAAAYFAPALASAGVETAAGAGAAEAAGSAAGGMGGGTASLFGPGTGLGAELAGPAAPLFPSLTPAAPGAIAGGAGIAGGVPGLFGTTPAGAGSLVSPPLTIGDLLNPSVPGDANMPGDLAGSGVDLTQVPGDAYLPGDLANNPNINLTQVPGDAYLPGDQAPVGPPEPTVSPTTPSTPRGATPPGTSSASPWTTIGDLINNPLVRGLGVAAGALIGRRGVDQATQAQQQGIDNAVRDVTNIITGGSSSGGGSNAGGRNQTKPPGTPGGPGNPYGSTQLGPNGLYVGGTMGMWDPYVQAGFDAINRIGSRPASGLYGKFGAPVAAPTGLTLGKLARPKTVRRA